MAAKRKASKGRGAQGAKPRRKAAPKQAFSSAMYAELRDERISYYYFVRRITKPPAIYDFLVRECRECLARDAGTVHNEMEVTHTFTPLISENRDSGLRMVQEVVMRLRQQAEPEEVLALRRPVETEKYRKTLEYLLQKQIEVIEDNSMVKVQKLSPSGSIVTVIEPRVSHLEKGKAIKAAMNLADKLAKVEGANMIAPEAPTDTGKGGGEGSREPYAFTFPHVKSGDTANALEDLIAMNLDRGRVN
jgi:hypothetical protein